MVETISHERAVSRLKELLQTESDGRFEMGDIALARAPMGDDGVNNGSRTELERLAAESGIEIERLDQYRRVAHGAEPSTRVLGVAWSVYREITLNVGDPAERQRWFDMIRTDPPTNKKADGSLVPTVCGRWTVDALRTHRGARPARFPPGDEGQVRRDLEELSPARRAAVIADAVAADSKVAVKTIKTIAAKQPKALKEAIEDTDTNIAISRAQKKVGDEAHKRIVEGTKRDRARDPIARMHDQAAAMVDLNEWVHDAYKLIDELNTNILPRLGTLSGGGAQFMLKGVWDALQMALIPVRSFIETGKTDTDHFLDKVLKGGKTNG